MPVLLYLVTPRSLIWVRDLAIVTAVICITVSGLDLILRLWVVAGISTTRVLPHLPIQRWDLDLTVRVRHSETSRL